MSEDFEDYLRIYVPKDLRLLDEHGDGWELEALLETVEEAMKAARAGKETEIFQMVVEVPADLDRQELDKLFEVVATAAHEIEDRFPQRTWDVFVAGGVLSEEHSAEAAFRRVFDENERLREQHEDSVKINEDWQAYKRRVQAQRTADRRALTAALGLEKDVLFFGMDALIERAAAQRAENDQLRRLLHKLYPVTMWSQASLTRDEQELFTRAYGWAEREADQ
jgi:hypothetical protein